MSHGSLYSEIYSYILANVFVVVVDTITVQLPLQIEHDNDRNGQCFVTQIYDRENKNRMSLDHQRHFAPEGEVYGEYGKVTKVKLHEERKKDKVIKKLCKEAQRKGSRLCRRGVETRQVEFNIRLPSQWDWSRGQCIGLKPDQTRDKKCNCSCRDLRLVDSSDMRTPQAGVGWLTQCPNRWAQGHYWAQAQLLFFGGVKKFFSAKSLFSQSLFYICQNYTQNRKYSKTTKKGTKSPAPPLVTPML